MVPVAWSEVTGRKRPAARSLPLWPPPRPGVSRFRHFRSHLAGVCALQLRPWPAFRPGVRLFRRFRSHLAGVCALQPRPWPASRPGVSLFRRFRSHLADGAPAAASPWNNWAAWEEHRDAWNNRRPWNIAVRTELISCAPGPLVRTALSFSLSRAHESPSHARDGSRAHGTKVKRRASGSAGTVFRPENRISPALQKKQKRKEADPKGQPQSYAKSDYFSTIGLYFGTRAFMMLHART